SLCVVSCLFILFLLFYDTATTEIYTLSLHDALPIFACTSGRMCVDRMTVFSRPISLISERISTIWLGSRPLVGSSRIKMSGSCRSEEHTSELQSRSDLVCRLLLEKKKKKSKQ